MILYLTGLSNSAIYKIFFDNEYSNCQVHDILNKVHLSCDFTIRKAEFVCALLAKVEI